MFGNQNNNKKSSINVNTPIKTFYCDTSLFQLSYWNDKLSVRINPVLKVDANGLKTYDFKSNSITSIHHSKCKALAIMIKEKIFPAIENIKNGGSLTEPVVVGVQTNDTGNKVLIEYKNDESSTPSIYFTIINIASDNTTKIEESFKFNKVAAIDNYNKDSDASSTSFIEAEFITFYEVLNKIISVWNSSVHATAYDNAFKQIAFNKAANQGAENINNTHVNNNYSAPVTTFTTDAFPFS